MSGRLAAILRNDYAASAFRKGNTIIWGLLSTVCLNRALGPSLRGEYAYYMNIVSIIVVIYGWGFSNTYPNFLRRNYPNARQVFLTFYMCQFVLIMVLSVIGSLASGNFQVGLFGVLAGSSVFATQVNNLLLVKSVRASALVGAFSAVLNVVFLGLMLFLRPEDLLLAFAVYAINSVVLGFLSLYFGRTRPSLRLLKMRDVIVLVRTGFIPMLTNVLVVINYRVDLLMLAWFHVDYYYIGLYAVGVSIAEYCWVIPDAFKDVIINRTAKDKSISSIAFSLRVSMTVLVLIFGVLGFTCRYLIDFAYGPDFGEASGITLIMFVGVYSMVFTKIIGVSFLASGRWGFYFRVLLVASVLNLALNVVVIPIYGIYGAAVVSVTTYSLSGVWFVVMFLRENSVALRDVLWVRSEDVTSLRHLLRGLVPSRSNLPSAE